MARPISVVLDTSAVISYLWGSTAMAPVIAAMRRSVFVPVVSPAMLAELREVLSRPKIRRHIGPTTASAFLQDLAAFARIAHPGTAIRCCEDPDDDMVLECAWEGNAGYIITGDKHLLKLHPFRGISILSPSAFVRAVLQPSGRP